MSGAWVFICGPSGAGKDSVIAWARDQLAGNPDVVFSQRLMTRPAAAGVDHNGMAAEQFESLLRGGALAWHWQAHGFHYGIPARYAQQVRWGRVVVINGSREHVAGLRRSAALQVIQIAADPRDIATRLAQRGRDTPEAVAGRLARNALLAQVDADLVIANVGELAVAGGRLARHLASLAMVAARAPGFKPVVVLDGK